MKEREIVERIRRSGIRTKEDIVNLLALGTPEGMEELRRWAFSIKQKIYGNKVYIRGIIEFSNICQKNCYYCGIRKDNKNTRRYKMPKEEILESVDLAYSIGYRSIVLQSGELENPEFIYFVDEIVREIYKKYGENMCIVLCVGEQEYEVYKLWYKSGARRYLLRIEVSNPELYKKLHPPDHSYERRKRCLEYLKEIGYQVGTGVMIGLPFQTLENLAEDILFFKEIDADMIGMGPYIVHGDTPLGKIADNSEEEKERRFWLSMKMIAITRIVMPDVNIASTTALQALKPMGREIGFTWGANVIMPNLTPKKYRADYQLYEGKPCIDETATDCVRCMDIRAKMVGHEIVYGDPGNPLHFYKRTSKLST